MSSEKQYIKPNDIKNALIKCLSLISVKGYFNADDGLFYEDQLFNNIMTSNNRAIHYDITTDLNYIWNGSKFVKLPIDNNYTNEDKSIVNNISQIIPNDASELNKLTSLAKVVEIAQYYSGGDPTLPETFENKTISIELNNIISSGSEGNVLVVNNNGIIQADSDFLKTHIAAHEYCEGMSKELADYLIGLKLIAQNNGTVCDISGCKDLKQHLQALINNNSGLITNDDKIACEKIKEVDVDNPYGQSGIYRWDTRQLYGYKKVGDTTNTQVLIPNNSFRLPLEINPSPTPGESSIMVNSSFQPSQNATEAFRIEADALIQQQIIQQAQNVPIEYVAIDGKQINGGIQFLLNNKKVYAPLFSGSQCNYYSGGLNFVAQICPQVNSLPNDTVGYCFNLSDNYYYYRQQITDNWTNISDQNATPHINFVSELPDISLVIHGALYVLNSDIGFINSIYQISWQYLKESLPNNQISAFTHSNFYYESCPEQSVAPDPLYSQYYFDSTNQKYYHWNGSLWDDITQEPNFSTGSTYPTNYNDGDYFVLTNEFGLANSLQVAKVVQLTGVDIQVFTIAGCIDIKADPSNLQDPGYVDVTDIYLVVNYTSSNEIYTITVQTLSNSYDVGQYVGTYNEAPDYIKSLLDTVLSLIGNEVYTHSTEDGNVSVYDIQGSYLNDGTITNGALTYSGTSYARDDLHDTDAHNYLRTRRVAYKRAHYDLSEIYKTIPQTLPNLKSGSWGTPGDTAANRLTGLVQKTGEVAGAPNGEQGSNSAINIDFSRGDNTYSGKKVNVSSVQDFYFVALKNFNMIKQQNNYNEFMSVNTSDSIFND